MDNLKKLIYLLMVVMLCTNVFGDIFNKTEFDDGGSNINISENSTHYVTLPLNSEILNSSLAIKGYSSQDAIIVSDSFSNEGNIASNSYGVVTNDNLTIALNYDTQLTFDEQRTGITFSSEETVDCYDSGTSSDNAKPVNFTATNSSLEKISGAFYQWDGGEGREYDLRAVIWDQDDLRYSQRICTADITNVEILYDEFPPSLHSLEDVQVNFTFTDCTLTPGETYAIAFLDTTTDCDDAGGDANSMEFMDSSNVESNEYCSFYVDDYNSGSPSVLTDCVGFANEMYVEFYYTNYHDIATITSLALDSSAKNIKKVYFSVTENEIYESYIDYYLSSDDSNFESVTPNSYHTFSNVGSSLKYRVVLNKNNSNSSPTVEDITIKVDDLYPTNVSIKVNETIIFNHSGNLTGTNSSIDLNTTLFQNYFSNDRIIPVDFIADEFGYLNIFDLFIRYNSSAANPNIDSPSQITSSIISGEDVEVELNISNNGNSNATNIFFITVSESTTPNYNDSISFTCSQDYIDFGSSITCDLIFNSLTSNPETDEKLRSCILSTETNETICSNSIDVDITVSSPPSSPSPGGGNSDDTATEAQFHIYAKNTFAENTDQLSIRPDATRTYCMEIVSVASDSQTINLKCANPSQSELDVCSWIEFQNSTIIVQPSPEIREEFCLDITTPLDILIGEKFVINIIGTASKPSSLQGTKKIHAITMTVTDPAFLLQELLAKLQETSIMDSFYGFIREYYQEDINVIRLKNYLNPLIYLPHIFLFLIIRFTIRKPGIFLNVILQVLLGIITIISLFIPAILAWELIIFFFIMMFTAISQPLRKSRRFKKNINS